MQKPLIRFIWNTKPIPMEEKHPIDDTYQRTMRAKFLLTPKIRVKGVGEDQNLWLLGGSSQTFLNHRFREGVCVRKSPKNQTSKKAPYAKQSLQKLTLFPRTPNRSPARPPARSPYVDVTPLLRWELKQKNRRASSLVLLSRSTNFGSGHRL